MIKAKKHFGQNFLEDKSVVGKIIQAIPKDTKNIVEIGPGLGDLTQELLKISKVKAYEIDNDLIPVLENKFQEFIKCGKFRLIHQDASKAFENSLDEDKYFLVANLPYYIASNIILNSLKDDNCSGLIVMVQKEIALKFCAKVKNSDFCAISILSALICDRKILFEVEPKCFNPPPKVMSAVMILNKKFKYQDFCDINLFQIFLRDCFKAPRKKLISNINIEKDKIKNIFDKLNLKEDIRPHEICVDSYLAIFNNLKDEYERRYNK